MLSVPWGPHVRGRSKDKASGIFGLGLERMDGLMLLGLICEISCYWAHVYQDDVSCHMELNLSILFVSFFRSCIGPYRAVSNTVMVPFMVFG